MEPTKPKKPESPAPKATPPVVADEKNEADYEPSGWNRRSWFISEFLHPDEKE
jgi:hypothetical protein